MKIKKLVPYLIAHKKFKKKMADEKYCAELCVYLAHDNKAVFKGKEITDAVADALGKQLTGDIEADRNIVDDWISKHFDDGSKLRRKHAKHKSIAERIKAGDLKWTSKLGTTSDFQYFVEIDKVYINKTGQRFKVCAPVAMDKTQLKNKIESALGAAKSKNKLTLLVPINVDQLHWVLAKITIENKKIVHVSLFDSRSGLESGKAVFSSVINRLNPKIKVEDEFKGIQTDGYTCFDHVVKEMLRLLKPKHKVVTAGLGGDLRQCIGDVIASVLNVPLPGNEESDSEDEGNISVNVDSADVLVDDKNLLAKFQKLKSMIAKKYLHSEDIDGLRILEKEDGLHVAPSGGFSVDEGVGSQDENEVDTEYETESETDDEKFPQFGVNSAYLRSDDESSIEDDLTVDEQRFIDHYDDSSDEEDKGYDVTAKELNRVISESNFEKKNKKSTTQSPQKKNKKPEQKQQEEVLHKKISLALYVLGNMVLRSKKVKPYYQRFKQTHLSMTAAEFEKFKRKFIDEFSKAFTADGVKNDKSTIEKVIWPYFLRQFRQKAKGQRGKKGIDIYQDALTSTLLYLLDKQKLNENEKIMVGRLAEKIVLPARTIDMMEMPNIQQSAKESNLDYHLAGLTLLLHRWARRLHKQGASKKLSLKTKIGINAQTTPITLDVGFNRGQRTDLLGGKIGRYHKLLSGKGNTASVKKYTDEGNPKRSSRDFTKHFRQAQGTKSFEPISNKRQNSSYQDFLRKFYFLLQQVEGGRNPATLLINVMLIQLLLTKPAKGESAITWEDILPNNEEQHKFDAENHPKLIHPMTFADASHAAVCLNEQFNALGLDFQLTHHYNAAQKDREKDAKIIAKKQYAIAAEWWKRSTGNVLSADNVDDFIDDAVELARTYYKLG